MKERKKEIKIKLATEELERLLLKILMICRILDFQCP